MNERIDKLCNDNLSAGKGRILNKLWKEKEKKWKEWKTKEKSRDEELYN